MNKERVFGGFYNNPIYEQQPLNQQMNYGQPPINQQMNYGQSPIHQQMNYGQPPINQQIHFGQPPNLNNFHSETYGQPFYNQGISYGPYQQPNFNNYNPHYILAANFDYYHRRTRSNEKYNSSEIYNLNDGSIYLENSDKNKRNHSYKFNKKTKIYEYDNIKNSNISTNNNGEESIINNIKKINKNNEEFNINDSNISTFSNLENKNTDDGENSILNDKNKQSQKYNNNEKNVNYHKSFTSPINYINLNDYEKEIQSKNGIVCKITGKINKENDRNSYYKGNLSVAIKEVEAKNDDLLGEIKTMSIIEEIKIYDYFEDKNNTNKLYIIFEDKEENISKLNNFLNNEENKIGKELKPKNSGEPIKFSELNELKKKVNQFAKYMLLKVKAVGVFVQY